MRNPFCITLFILGIAGCAQEFPITPLAPAEQHSETEFKASNSVEGTLALGQMYFLHNRIDEAGALLDAVVAQEPDNAQALAWRGANDCKKAGRRGPWLMGLDKLYLVHRCLSEIDTALQQEPDDFVVQMVQMNTAAEVNLFGSLDRARETMARVSEQIEHSRTSLAPDLVAQFYVTAAKIERVSGNHDKAAELLQSASALGLTGTTRQLIAAERQLLVN